MKKLKKLFSIMFVGLLVCVSAIGFCVCGKKDDSAKKAEMLNKVRTILNDYADNKDGILNNISKKAKYKSLSTGIEVDGESWYVIDDYVVTIDEEDDFWVLNFADRYCYSGNLTESNGSILPDFDYTTKSDYVLTVIIKSEYLNDELVNNIRVTSYATAENGNLRIELAFDLHGANDEYMVDDQGDKAILNATCKMIVEIDENDRIVKMELSATEFGLEFEEGFDKVAEAQEKLETDIDIKIMKDEYTTWEYEYGTVSKEALETEYGFSFEEIDAMAITE